MLTVASVPAACNRLVRLNTGESLRGTLCWLPANVQCECGPQRWVVARARPAGDGQPRLRGQPFR